MLGHSFHTGIHFYVFFLTHFQIDWAIRWTVKDSKYKTFIVPMLTCRLFCECWIFSFSLRVCHAFEDIHSPLFLSFSRLSNGWCQKIHAMASCLGIRAHNRIRIWKFAAAQWKIKVVQLHQKKLPCLHQSQRTWMCEKFAKLKREQTLKQFATVMGLFFSSWMHEPCSLSSAVQ